MKKNQIVTGLVLGTWDNTFEVIANARNTNRPKARKMYPCLVEHFRFNIHHINRGKPTVRPVASLQIPRTRAAMERAAYEWSKAHPGKPFQIVYEGWFDGTNCLPRYNDGDRDEKIVTFAILIYTHSGDAGLVVATPADVAADAVMAALSSQS